MAVSVWKYCTFYRNFHTRYLSSCRVEPFRSFIFLDLETTGLQRPIFITEVSLVAVSRGRLLRKYPGLPEHPRILDKLTVCVNPRKRIEQRAGAISGLNNTTLFNLKGFDRDLGLSLVTFIKRQPPPSCLVGHNGDSYDFDIFFSHLFEHDLELPSHVKVVDSLKGFRYLHSRDNPASGKEKISFNLSSIYNRLLGDGYCAHSAEFDCLALMRCVQKTPSILPWIDENAHDVMIPKNVVSLPKGTPIVGKQVKESVSKKIFTSNKNIPVLPKEMHLNTAQVTSSVGSQVKESVAKKVLSLKKVTVPKEAKQNLAGNTKSPSFTLAKKVVESQPAVPQRHLSIKESPPQNVIPNHYQQEPQARKSTIQNDTASYMPSRTSNVEEPALKLEACKQRELQSTEPQRKSIIKDRGAPQKVPSTISNFEEPSFNQELKDSVIKQNPALKVAVPRKGIESSLPKARPSIKVPVVRREHGLRTDGDFMLRNDSPENL